MSIPRTTLHRPKARQIDWLNVGLVLRDHASAYTADAEKFGEDIDDPRMQRMAIQHGTAGLVLLSLAIALQQGTL